MTVYLEHNRLLSGILRFSALRTDFILISRVDLTITDMIIVKTNAVLIDEGITSVYSAFKAFLPSMKIMVELMSILPNCI